MFVYRAKKVHNIKIFHRMGTERYEGTLESREYDVKIQAQFGTVKICAAALGCCAVFCNIDLILQCNIIENSAGLKERRFNWISEVQDLAKVW